MQPIIFFDPKFTGGDVVNRLFSEQMGSRNPLCYPPEPCSRNLQVAKHLIQRWFNGFDTLSLNFFAQRDEMGYGPDVTYVTILGHPLDRLYRQFIFFLNQYLSIPEYASGEEVPPPAFQSFLNFASLPQQQNQLVRFFAETDDPVLDDHHLDTAITNLSSLDYVGDEAGLSSYLMQLVPKGNNITSQATDTLVSEEQKKSEELIKIGRSRRDMGQQLEWPFPPPSPAFPLASSVCQHVYELNSLDIQFYSLAMERFSPDRKKST